MTYEELKKHVSISSLHTIAYKRITRISLKILEKRKDNKLIEVSFIGIVAGEKVFNIVYSFEENKFISIRKLKTKYIDMDLLRMLLKEDTSKIKERFRSYVDNTIKDDEQKAIIFKIQECIKVA